VIYQTSDIGLEAKVILLISIETPKYIYFISAQYFIALAAMSGDDIALRVRRVIDEVEDGRIFS
jgi:hypothetical protein